jgi:hypothetical protein
MSLFRQAKRNTALDEDPVVRQYRYLLRTAPADALIAVNAEALGALDGVDRRAVLTTVQEQMVAGGRLTESAVPAIARLVSLGERRQPGALLHHLEAGTLLRLAQAALDAEAAFGLLNGYADWDGKDPEPSAQAQLEKDFGTRWHDARLNPGATLSQAIGPTEGIGGGYDGGSF